MEHTRHDSRHAQQGIVFLGRSNVPKAVIIPQLCEDKSANATEEQTGREGTPATATTVRSRCGKYLGEEDQTEVEQEVFRMTVEEGVVEHVGGILLSRTIEQHRDGGVTFSVKRGKEVDEQCKHRATECQA